MPHDLYYTVVMKDRECLHGSIEGFSSDSLILNSQDRSGATISLPKSEVLRIGFSARRVYYNARSSWLDASTAIVREHESLIVVTRDGKQHRIKGKHAFSDTDLTYKEGAASRSLPKTGISKIYLDAVKPLPADREYFLEELGPLVIFDGDAYRYWWHLEGHVAVLLYDAARPEDNRPIDCLTLP